jgi:opacity protein-like surface antigen
MGQGGKIFLMAGVLAGVSLLFSAGAFYAGMVGAPEGRIEANEGGLFDLPRWNLGTEADWVFNKDMKVGERSSEKVLLSRAYRARIGYEMWGPFELYGLAGAADLELESLDSTGDRIKDEYGFGAQLGGGLKAHLELPDDWWNVRATIDGQFLYGESDVQSSRGSRSGAEVNSRGEIIAKEYHAALTVGRAYSVNQWTFVPYIGGRWSQLLLRENDRDSDNLVIPKASWRTEHHLGAIAGLSSKWGENWELTVEGRFIDETAVSANARFRF